MKDDSRRQAILDRVAQLSASLPKRTTRKDRKRLAKPPESQVAPMVTASQKPGHPYPSSSPVLDRPYLHISGRRHVPKLVDANRFPFLRIKKPQSPLIGALIRRASRLREKRAIRTVELEKVIDLGKEEDEWDKILDHEFNTKSPGSSWAQESSEALNEIRRRHEAVLAKRISTAKQMTIIVEKEEALALKEELELEKGKQSGGRRNNPAVGGRKDGDSTGDMHTPAGSTRSGVSSIKEHRTDTLRYTKPHEHSWDTLTRSRSTSYSPGEGPSTHPERPPTNIADQNIGTDDNKAVLLNSSLQGGHSSAAHPFKSIANVYDVRNSKRPRVAGFRRLQQREGSRLISNRSRAHRRPTVLRKDLWPLASDPRSTDQEANRRMRSQVRQFSASKRLQENNATSIPSAFDAQTKPRSQAAPGTLQIVHDISRQSTDGHRPSDSNSKTARTVIRRRASIRIRRFRYDGVGGQKDRLSESPTHAGDASPRIRRLQYDGVEGQRNRPSESPTHAGDVSFRIRRLEYDGVKSRDNRLSQSPTHAGEARKLERAQEMAERHQRGEAVTVRQHLKRDVPLNKPQRTEKSVESRDGDAESADVIVRNRVGAPVVRKVSKPSSLQDTTNDISKPE